MNAMTKAETKIVDYVRYANSLGAKAGLGTFPEDANFSDPKQRFIKRLSEAGVIVWSERSKRFGAGWVLPENLDTFKDEAGK